MWMLHSFACKSPHSSASLHLLSFYSCSDLHNVSYSQELLLKYVCTDKGRYAHISISMWLAHYIAVTSQMHLQICVLLSFSDTDREPELVFYPPLFLMLPSQLCNYAPFVTLMCVCVCLWVHCKELCNRGTAGSAEKIVKQQCTKLDFLLKKKKKNPLTVKFNLQY